MLTIFHVQNVPIIFDWCLCDFLVLKYIDEVYALHVHLSFTHVYIFLCRKCSRISILFLIIYWYWLLFMCKMFLSFSTDVCDFLVLKHIDEVHTLHLHLSLTDVDIFVCGKYSNISVVCLIINWCWLFFMCKMFLSFSTDVYVIFLYWNILMKCTHFHFRLMSIWFSYTETHQWSVCTSSSFVIYWCWHIFVSKMFHNFNIVFDYLLILTIFPVQNVLIIFNWCMWFSCTETYWWSAHTSSSFVIDWCWHFCLWKNILIFQ